MKVLSIIPARYQSSRFPGKPLADISGKTMIRRVYEQASKAFENVVIATDDNRIYNEAKKINANVVLTSDKHKSGTDRCFEALEKFSKQQNTNFEVVINIQGDEPLLNPPAVKKLAKLFYNKKVKIATLVNKVRYSNELLNPNRVKVVIDKNKKSVYFSRSLIPFVRNKDVLDKIYFYIHVGIYGFRSEVLKQVSALSSSMIEKAESLEQNRWIENGYSIYVSETEYESVPVDTPDDLKQVNELLQNSEN